jgi:hypothetical protein
MKAFGGTCPMCCGDLDDAVHLETGAAVCLYCGHKREVSANRASRRTGSAARAAGNTSVATRPERVRADGQSRAHDRWLRAEPA